jgi:hypothetical protein
VPQEAVLSIKVADLVLGKFSAMVKVKAHRRAMVKVNRRATDKAKAAGRANLFRALHEAVVKAVLPLAVEGRLLEVSNNFDANELAE